jgi:hypothetical protein
MRQLLIYLCAFANLPAIALAQEQQQPAYSCDTTVQHRQFDFWLGQWEVTDKAGNTVYGHNEISKHNGGCLLLEQWRSSRGGTGSSINYYDPVQGQWHQDWVDASSIIHTAGGINDAGAMVMQGTITYLEEQREAGFRASWISLSDGRVRQTFEEQDEQGRWQPWFEGYYRQLTPD